MDLLTIWRHGAVQALLCGWCALAGAAPTSAPSSTPGRTAALAAPLAVTPSAAGPAAGSTKAADDAELDAARGGAGANATLIDTRLAGQVSGNSANNVQTGWNVIDGGAFSNMTGIPIVVQNSGANVLIQNATVIHLQLQ
jgi:hypothetical protein